MGFRHSGLRIRVQELGFGLNYGLGFRAYEQRFRDWGLGMRGWGLEIPV